jgi:hypothetical protein
MNSSAVVSEVRTRGGWGGGTTVYVGGYYGSSGEEIQRKMAAWGRVVRVHKTDAYSFVEVSFFVSPSAPLSLSVCRPPPRAHSPFALSRSCARALSFVFAYVICICFPLHAARTLTHDLQCVCGL